MSKLDKHRFFSYSWFEDKNETEVTAIRIYGIDEENKTVCVRVNDFTPYVYIELPEMVKTSSQAQIIGDKIDQLMGNARPLSKSLMMKKKLYGAHGSVKGLKFSRKKFPYLFCSFSNKSDIKNLGYKIRRPLTISGIGSVYLKIHEQSAEPILQLGCCRDIPTAGWIDFAGEEVTDENDKLTTAHREFKVKWKGLMKFEKDVLPKPTIFGFDIEVNSSIPSKMPDPEIPADKVFQISCVVSMGDNTIKHLLTMGDPDPKIVGNDVIIHTYDTEEALLNSFIDLIVETKANIIVGYNIFKFDIPYLIDRTRSLMIINNFAKQGFHKFLEAEEKTIKWTSAAYKNQEFQYMDAEGRLFVDLLPIVKRDYKLNQYSLKAVSTEFLGETKDPLSAKGIFKCYRIGMSRDENGNFTKKARKAMGIVGKYCVKDSDLCILLMEKLRVWVGLTEMSKTCNVPIFYLYTKGQQIKVFSQLYKYCTYNNIVIEKDAYITAEGERYTGAHVFPPIPDMYEGGVAPFDFASLYPTTMIAYNIDYHTWVTDESIPDKLCHVFDWEDHVGCAHDPKVIRKTELTEYINGEEAKIKAVRARRDKTKGKEAKKKVQDEINAMVAILKPYKEERSEIMKSKPKFPMCAKRHYRFLKEPKGVIPTILQNLLDARRNTRKQIKVIEKRLETEELSDEERKDIKDLIVVLDKRQKSYKVSCNSMYGAMGVKKGYLPFMPGAMCTTFMGRTNNIKVSEIIVEKYEGELVYGDTDSCYIHFPKKKTAQEVWDYSLTVASEITKIFPPPIELEFEMEIYWKFLILTKKRYMYWMCRRDGIVNKKIGKKGVLLARRDNAKFVRDFYESIIDKLFNGIGKEDNLYYIVQRINLLFCYYFPLKDFIITKSVGSSGNLIAEPFVDDMGHIVKGKAKVGDYKVNILSNVKDERLCQLEKKGASNAKEYYLLSLPAQVQLAEKIRRRGQIVDNGSRIEYVITEQGGLKAKQYEKIEAYDYFNAHSDILKIDFFYYLKALSNPLDQVLNVVYGREKEKGVKHPFIKNFILSQYNFRLKVRYKVMEQIKSLNRPKLEFKE